MDRNLFLCPWNSPGKNPGVGSHSLLQGIFSTQGSPTLQAGSFPSEPPTVDLLSVLWASVCLSTLIIFSLIRKFNMTKSWSFNKHLLSTSLCRVLCFQEFVTLGGSDLFKSVYQLISEITTLFGGVHQASRLQSLEEEWCCVNNKVSHESAIRDSRWGKNAKPFTCNALWVNAFFFLYYISELIFQPLSEEYPF